MSGILSKEQLELTDAYWRASNYLTVGQIYLQGNPLLREKLRPEHIKPRLLGHWGTSPGQNFIYVHLNRLIKETDANMIYVCGPGHGGPAIVAQTYLKGLTRRSIRTSRATSTGYDCYSGSSPRRVESQSRRPAFAWID